MISLDFEALVCYTFAMLLCELLFRHDIASYLRRKSLKSSDIAFDTSVYASFILYTKSSSYDKQL